MKPLQLWLGFVASLRILSVYFGYLKPEMIQDGVFINAKDQGEDAPRVHMQLASHVHGWWCCGGLWVPEVPTYSEERRELSMDAL